MRSAGIHHIESIAYGWIGKGEKAFSIRKKPHKHCKKKESPKRKKKSSVPTVWRTVICVMEVGLWEDFRG